MKKIIPFEEELRVRVQNYANHRTNGNFTKASLKLIELSLDAEPKTLQEYLAEGGVESEQRVKSEKQGQEESSGN